MANTKIPSELIADSSITAAKLADGTITTADIADSNVTTAKIADSNVTTAKIGDAQVTTAKITDANVTTGKIADDAVTTAKMASNSVTSDTIASGITFAGNTTFGGNITQGSGDYIYNGGGNFDIKHTTASQNIVFSTTPSGGSATEVLRITHDGKLSKLSGDLTLDVAGDIVLDADGGDVRLKDNGTEFLNFYAGTIERTGSLIFDVSGNITLNADGSTISLADGSLNFGQFYQNASGALNIYAPTQDKDIVFLGNDGGSTVTALTLDMSAAGAATFNNSITSGNGITMNAGNLTLNSTSDGNQAFRYYRADGTLVSQQYPYNNRMNFQTYNNQGLRLKSHGSGQIELEGNVVINEDSADLDFRVESDGDQYALFLRGSDGNIGIGTSNPLFDLHVSSPNTQIAIESTTNGQNSSLYYRAHGASQWETGVNIVANLDYEIYDRVNNASRLVVGHNGTVTIPGTISSGAITSSGNLHAGDGTNISMDSSANGQLEVDGSGYQGAIALDGNAMHVYHNSASRDLVFGTNETARLNISGTGLFDFQSNNLQSIGTISSGAITSSGTSTFASLTANGLTVNTGALRLASLDTSVNDTESIGDIEFYSSDSSTGGAGVQAKISALSDSAYGVSYALSFATGSGASPTEKMRIDNTGKVGIGISGGNLKSKLHVRAPQNNTMTSENAFAAFDGTGGDGLIIGARASSPFEAYIQAGYTPNIGTSHHYPLVLNPHGGNVGIGALNPQSKLHLESGNAHNKLSITSTASGGTGYDAVIDLLGSASNSEVALNMGINGDADREQIKTYQSIMSFKTNNQERMVIGSNGKVVLHGNASNWNETQQGQTTGSLHLDPGTNNDNEGNAITWGASDHSNGTVADAGIYVRSDGAYGTKMYISTTDSYAVGSKTSIKIDQAGRVTTPRQPAFQAYLSSGQSVTGTETTVAFNTENFDRAGNHSNGVFTAPVGGVYTFGVNFLLYPFTSGIVNCRFYINSSAGTVVQHGASNNSHTGVSMTTTVNLSANDTVTFRVSGSGLSSTNVYGGQAYWHGHLVG